jgi:hypothetical protein
MLYKSVSKLICTIVFPAIYRQYFFSFFNCFLLKQRRLNYWDFDWFSMIHSHISWPRSGDCEGSRIRTRDSCVLCLVSPSCLSQLSHHIHNISFYHDRKKFPQNRILFNAIGTPTVPRTTIPRTTIPRTTIPRTTIPRTTIPRTTLPRSDNP